MNVNIGDKVKVVAIDEGYIGTDEYAIGDVLTVTDVVERRVAAGGLLIDAEDERGRLIELYDHEIEVVTDGDIFEELRDSLKQALVITADNDTVAHPSHYTQGGVEVIDIIAQTVSGYDDGFTAHCVGTATKYLNRAPYKHETPLEDLRKAAKYLEFAIAHEEQKGE